MKFPIALVAALVLALLSPAMAEKKKNYLKAFPAAEEGMVRYVIELPHKERGEEDAFRVELLVGKRMMTDGVNKVRLGGEIQAKPLKGWGFTFYQVDELGPGMSTRIGVAPGTPQVEKFVSGPNLQIRYNSRVPIVVYVPEGALVKYRIWKADPEFQSADKKD